MSLASMRAPWLAKVCFGTIDSFLLFKLTGGRTACNRRDQRCAHQALRHQVGQWDERLLHRLSCRELCYPRCGTARAILARPEPEHFGRTIPIRGVAGDQQAAAYGQACFTPGMLKATYGTGCFVVANTGEEKVASATRMLSTIFHQVGGKRVYALEGAIFMAGATVQWLRDNLGLIATAADSEALAKSANLNSGVYLVPAFRVSAPRSGMLMPRPRSSVSPAPPPGPISLQPGSRRSLSRRAIS
jgi:glycerol kinase